MGKYNINELYEGQFYEEEFIVSEDMGEAFAKISNDFNPIHLDAQIAAKSRFGKKIVHGMLIGSYFSGIIGNKFPGAGSVYISQDILFRKPVYYNTNIKIRVEITAVDKERKRIFLKTQCMDADDILLVDGNAKILLES